MDSLNVNTSDLDIGAEKFDSATVKRYNWINTCKNDAGTFAMRPLVKKISEDAEVQVAYSTKSGIRDEDKTG